MSYKSTREDDFSLLHRTKIPNFKYSLPDDVTCKNLITCTSTILFPTGDQYPTVYLTQSFWMAVAPPILVANHI